MTGFSIDTFVPPAWEFAKGHSFNLLGRFEEAISQILPVLERVPGFVPGRVQLTRAYHELGLDAQARATIDRLKKVAPKYTVRSAARMFPYPNKSDRDRLGDALRGAGLPD